jgi:hypothetical protein
VIGGHELFHSIGDGINEKGLNVKQLVDPQAITTMRMPFSGRPKSGLNLFQAIGLILNIRSAVEQTKMALLRNRIGKVMIGIYLFIADGTGAATGFEVDHDTQSYRFTDRVADRSFLFSTTPQAIKG